MTGYTDLWHARIGRLIERDGDKCHYCKRAVHMRPTLAARRLDDATIDHKVPESRGGTNEFDNLVMACRKCNHAKGDRDYEDFLAYPYPLPQQRRPLLPASPWPRDRGPLPKPRAGTLAAAIECGEIDPAGSSYIKPRMSAEETSRWLRERAKGRGESE